MAYYYFNKLTKGLGWCLTWVMLLVGSVWASPALAQTLPWTWALTAPSPQLLGHSNSHGIATDASGNIYVTGYFNQQLVFGTTTLTSQGGDDIFVAKYVPSTGTWAWALRAGGTNADLGYGVAISGSSVYITGSMTNDAANSRNVTFSTASNGTGTVAQPGAYAGSYSFDLVVAKYTDHGTSATLDWVQVGGGYDVDYGTGIAASGSSVYVTGTFTNNAANANTVLFGGTGPTPGTTTVRGVSSTNSRDLLLAKYTDNGSSATLAWTQTGGGTGHDFGFGLAASGNAVYLSGTIVNNLANANAVVLGGTGSGPGTSAQYGASATVSNDILLVKYLDQGSTASVVWSQVGGGTGTDQSWGLALSGSSVYITGQLANNRTNDTQVVFGGTGTTPGSRLQYGAVSSADGGDLVLAKYTDQGSTATLNWTHVGGGRDADGGYGIAVGGNRVFVTGFINNDLANTYGVVFGGSGTAAGLAPQPGASSAGGYDVVVAGYTDNGNSATLNWTQTAGGNNGDYGSSLVVSGAQLYVVGTMIPVATFSATTFATVVGSPLNFLGAFAGAVPLASTSAAASAPPRLYPNPAAGAATLSGAAPGAAVGIFDALGRRVATAAADASGTAALPAGLAPGVYVVRAGAATVRWAVE